MPSGVDLDSVSSWPRLSREWVICLSWLRRFYRTIMFHAFFLHLNSLQTLMFIFANIFYTRSHRKKFTFRLGKIEHPASPAGKIKDPFRDQLFQLVLRAIFWKLPLLFVWPIPGIVLQMEKGYFRSNGFPPAPFYLFFSSNPHVIFSEYFLKSPGVNWSHSLSKPKSVERESRWNRLVWIETTD